MSQPVAKLLATAVVSARSAVASTGSSGVERPVAPANDEMPNVPAMIRIQAVRYREMGLWA